MESSLTFYVLFTTFNRLNLKSYITIAWNHYTNTSYYVIDLKWRMQYLLNLTNILKEETQRANTKVSAEITFFKCSLKDLSHIFDRPCHYYICTVVFWCQHYSMLFIYGNLLFPTKQYLKYSWTKTPFSIII